MEKDEAMYQQAIGEILESMTDPTSKKVIADYSYSATYATNLKKIGSSSVADLEKCGVALGLKVRNEDNTKKYSNKKILADRIILKIESHFTQTCDECEQDYRNKFDAPSPMLLCYLCMQGSHDCKNFNDRIPSSSSEQTLVGQIWVCRGCRQKNNLSEPPKKSKQGVTFQDSEEAPEKEEESEERLSPRRDGNAAHNEEEDKEKICELYKRNRCPHGASGKREVHGDVCPHKHPRKCIKYCRAGKRDRGGCKKGKSCKFFHPVLCKFSVRKHECLNSECTYTHLKGTKRHSDRDGDHFPNFNRAYHQPPQQKEVRRTRYDSTSAASVASFNSDCYRTPFPHARVNNPSAADISRHQPQRQRRDSVQSNNSKKESFLEKLMENMKQDFDKQHFEMAAMKRNMEQQVEALWSKLNQNAPQMPPVQLPPLNQYPNATAQQMLPQMWNPLSNPPFMC